jgi:hypothetical protein
MRSSPTLIVLAAALAAALSPCATARAALTDEDGERVDPKPCEWVYSLEKGLAKASETRPVYIYFAPERNAKGKNLPVQFMYNEAMQNLSKKSAVFVLIAVPRKNRSEELQALLKKYRIRRTPDAVVTDHHGNLLGGASHTVTRLISKKIKAARTAVAKIKKLMAEHMKKGDEAMEKNSLGTAKFHFKWAAEHYPGYPEHDAAAAKLAELDEKEKQLKEAREKARLEAAAKRKEKVEEKAPEEPGMP